MDGWLDLQIDDATTRPTPARLGFDVAATRARICHWSAYLRNGAFPLYRALIMGDLVLPLLRAHLPTPRAAACNPLPPARNPA